MFKKSGITNGDMCECECHNEWFFTTCPNGCGCKPEYKEDKEFWDEKEAEHARYLSYIRRRAE